MALFEMPSGEFIDLKVVVGVRPVADDQGPRVVVDVSSAPGCILLRFDTPDAAYAWAREFASKVNEAVAA